MKHCLAYIVYLILLISLVVKASPNQSIVESLLNVTNTNTTSPWLKRVTDPRITNPRAQQGCSNRPWICSLGQFPPRRLCCSDRCIDINSDPLNCGFCGIRCPFTWRCCSGLCINVNISPLDCGKCGNRCSLGRPCVFGMCGYAQGLPGPFPFPPGLPGPPFPFPFPFPPGMPRPPGTQQQMSKNE
ncbi:Stigma-specific STIG1-like protein 4 [Bienertia sinuspersici]